MTSRVSLTELAAAGIRLRPAEAVTLVSEICRQYSAGTVRGIPSAGVIRITREGAVVAEGPVTTTEDPVQRAGQLLTVLVGGFDAPPEYRASGALQIVLARALGTLDLPRYTSLDEFCTALGRFATLDVGDTARDLFRDWIRTRVPREAVAAALTISDVRRARRATGLTLQDIATVAGVPAARLRDLEWGDMRTWRADSDGHAQVTRYARAAGLDDELVLSIAWPMIESANAGADAGVAPVTALVVVTPREPAPTPPPSPRATPWLFRHRGVTAVAALALAILAMFALARMRAPGRPAVRPDPIPVAVSEQPAVAPRVVAVSQIDQAPRTSPAVSQIDRAPRTSQAVSQIDRAPRTSLAVSQIDRAPRTSLAVSQIDQAPQPARRAASRKVPAKRPAARRTSVFHKELFRIEIR